MKRSQTARFEKDFCCGGSRTGLDSLSINLARFLDAWHWITHCIVVAEVEMAKPQELGASIDTILNLLLEVWRAPGNSLAFSTVSEG